MRDAPRHKSAPRRKRETGRGASQNYTPTQSLGAIGK
ncbi:hypothetical protein CCL18_15670 [Pseudomonas syringae]|nr:hypothetical protein CCL18_15670 [Pseudomonas syringae]